MKVAVVGATGAVGEVMLSILARARVPGPAKLFALASERSAGQTRRLRQRVELVVQRSGHLRSVGRRHRVVLGRWRHLEGVRAEVRRGRRDRDRQHLARSATTTTCRWWCRRSIRTRSRTVPRGIIANPNCSTMQMLVALAPIHRAVGIERINVATYQSVSGGGRSAMEELGRQTAAIAQLPGSGSEDASRCRSPST